MSEGPATWGDCRAEARGGRDRAAPRGSSSEGGGEPCSPSSRPAGRKSSFQPGPHDLVPLEDPWLLPGGRRARGLLAGGSAAGEGGAPPHTSSLLEGLTGLGGWVVEGSSACSPER